MEFYTSIAGYYDLIFPLEESQKSFIRNNISINDGTFIDVGCATGNLSIAMSSIMRQVIGIDFDGALIDIARSKNTGANTVFIRGDMLDIRRIIAGNNVISIACIGNTLVHLVGAEKINRFISESNSILEPGGKLILQIINYDNIMNNSVKNLKTIENKNVIFYRDYDYDSGRNLISFKTRLKIKKTGRLYENEAVLYPLRKDELEPMLSGFGKTSYYGSYDSDVYSPESFLLIAVAEK
jgi:glycine/sarcosine N-methyltransferase